MEGLQYACSWLVGSSAWIKEADWCGYCFLPPCCRAQDVRALHVAPHISWTSYLVMGTVLSKPQLLACMARLERMVRSMVLPIDENISRHHSLAQFRQSNH